MQSSVCLRKHLPYLKNIVLLENTAKPSTSCCLLASGGFCLHAMAACWPGQHLLQAGVTFPTAMCTASSPHDLSLQHTVLLGSISHTVELLQNWSPSSQTLSLLSTGFRECSWNPLWPFPQCSQLHLQKPFSQLIPGKWLLTHQSLGPETAAMQSALQTTLPALVHCKHFLCSFLTCFCPHRTKRARASLWIGLSLKGTLYFVWSFVQVTKHCPYKQKGYFFLSSACLLQQDF